MAADPVCTDPDKYQVIFENDRVRVLEYRDLPGGKTLPHQHPDSVMYTLSAFQRRLHVPRTRRRKLHLAQLIPRRPGQTGCAQQEEKSK